MIGSRLLARAEEFGDIEPCEFCGRCLLLGGYCCSGAKAHAYRISRATWGLGKFLRGVGKALRKIKTS